MRRVLALLAALSLFFIAGCRRNSATTAARPVVPPKVADAVLQKTHPNEAGAVMVVMYHRVLANEPDSDLNRRPETFRKDLATLRTKGYYPVTAGELVTNTMNVPAGKTPIVLTFDDALSSQFRVLAKSGEPGIDPDCAVGIMETFGKKHPDWPVHATFFVLPKEGRNSYPFGQAEYVADKFSYLVEHGHEVGNHTATHSSLRRKSATEVQWELATARRDIQAINPQAAMRVLALPYGKVPRAAAAQKALLSGEEKGTAYRHEAVFLAAWRPVLSPLTKSDKKATQGGSLCPFSLASLQRVKPDARAPSTPGTLEYWLNWFDKNPALRYVSDGNPRVAAIPIALKPTVDETRAKAQGKILQFYGAPAGQKSTGGGLSVH